MLFGLKLPNLGTEAFAFCDIISRLQRLRAGLVHTYLLRKRREIVDDAAARSEVTAAFQKLGPALDPKPKVAVEILADGNFFLKAT